MTAVRIRGHYEGYGSFDGRENELIEGAPSGGTVGRIYRRQRLGRLYFTNRWPFEDKLHGIIQPSKVRFGEG